MSVPPRTIQIMSPVYPGQDSPSYGIFVKNIADALARAGFRVDTRAVVRGRPVDKGARVKAHLRLGLGIAAAALRPADCVYVHMPTWFGVLAYGATLLLGKRLVLHLHGAELYPNTIFEKAGRRALPWLARHADRVVVPSEYFADSVSCECRLPRQRIFVSPSGGVDTSVFRPRDRVEARRALGLPSDKRLIGFVGRLVPRKGWDTFLRALAELSQQRNDVLGVIVGEGEESGKLDTLARELGVLEHVRRFGMMAQTDLPKVYASLDVLLFPTRRLGESLGLVPIEAMATGTLVVASRSFAVVEYVEHGHSGLLCAPESVEEFTNATRRLLDLPEEEAARMRKRAMASAGRYDSRVVMDRLIAELRSVMS